MATNLEKTKLTKLYAIIYLLLFLVGGRYLVVINKVYEGIKSWVIYTIRQNTISEALSTIMDNDSYHSLYCIENSNFPLAWDAAVCLCSAHVSLMLHCCLLDRV